MKKIFMFVAATISLGYSTAALAATITGYGGNSSRSFAEMLAIANAKGQCWSLGGEAVQGSEVITRADLLAGGSWWQIEATVECDGV